MKINVKTSEKYVMSLKAAQFITVGTIFLI